MELTKEFQAQLVNYDSALSAWFDGREDTIHVFSVRQGKKTLELSFKRQYGETYPELQRRIIKTIPEKDVWKRHGSGEAFDDYLQKEEDEYRAKKKREVEEKRKEYFKEHRWDFAAAKWNASHGRFTAKEARKFEIPTEFFPSKPPKEAKDSK